MSSRSSNFFSLALPVELHRSWCRAGNGFRRRNVLFESGIAINDQQSPWNIIFIISKKKYSWVISVYYWWFLTANIVRKRTCDRVMVSQAKCFVWVRNCHKWPAISMKYYFYNFKKEIFLSDFCLLLVISDRKYSPQADMWPCDGFASEMFCLSQELP